MIPNIQPRRIPTEEDWKVLATEEQTHLSEEDEQKLPGEWDEWIAEMRNDVARAALDGLIETMQDSPGIGPGTKAHRARMRSDVSIYRDKNFPKKEHDR